jgi:hypothetical protein
MDGTIGQSLYQQGNKMKNRELFVRDPITEHIPNNGVAIVAEAHNEVELNTLRYELKNFVCKGQYNNGLHRILQGFLASLSGGREQKGVWVSGFYGSGKSHLVKMLRFLWTDYSFTDGTTARGLVHGLSDDVRHCLIELETAGKRHGGLHAAAGTLGSKVKNDIPLAVLQIVLRSLNMPDQYPAAKLYLHLNQEGSLNKVKEHVEAQGKDFLGELKNMYVSAPLREALVAHSPGLDINPAEISSILRTQFPPSVDKISIDELVDTMQQAFHLNGPMPLTLLVLDELQQFIGDSPARSYEVQEIVEACSRKFESKLLFVATGQSSMTATPNLQRLTDRFPTSISLSDTDVDAVTREIVLNKKPSARTAIQEIVERNSGEIHRHLQNSAIAPKATDSETLVADYPILPVRRRFWEKVLRSVDPQGTSSMLRAQLRIIDEAVRGVAELELGSIVPADIIFDQMKDSMQQSGALMLEERDTIEKHVKDDSVNGRLKSRLCSLIFLIGKLPKGGAGDIGVRATPEMLSDLLVENLQAGGAELRRIVPILLQELENASDIMLVDGEYRIQTQEGAEWTSDFENRKRKITADKTRINEARAKYVQTKVESEIRLLNVLQGSTKVKRKISSHIGLERPPHGSGNVTLWIRDGWTVREKEVREDAGRAGTDDATVYVFIPQSSDELNQAIAQYEAAEETLQNKGIPTTQDGIQARTSIQQRKETFSQDIQRLVSEALKNSIVLQGGGAEVEDQQTLKDKLQNAADASAIRMFPKFHIADNNKWEQVVQRARAGSLDPLEVLGYHGKATEHQVCKAILEQLGSGKRGSEVRTKFSNEPFGWSQDAIDGALLALLAGGAIHAIRHGKAIQAKELDQKTIGDSDFRVENHLLSTTQRIEIRKLYQCLGLNCESSQELGTALLFINNALTLAASAGGPPPLPESPTMHQLTLIKEKSGNEQLLELHSLKEEIQSCISEWHNQSKLIEKRRPGWEKLNELLSFAGELPNYQEFLAQKEAIKNERQLLQEPDPVQPLAEAVAAELREVLKGVSDMYFEQYDAEYRTMEKSDAWDKLSDEQWETINRDANILKAKAPEFGDTTALIASLKSKSITTWRSEVDALPVRFGNAKKYANQILEPTSVVYTIQRPLLKSGEDVEAFITKLRDELLEKVAQNPVQVS